VDLEGRTLDEWRARAARRPAARPPQGYADDLEALAGRHLERLKEGGDWVVFPRVAFAFATGCYGIDDTKQLYYRQGNAWQAVTTVEFGPATGTPIV
jgi:hypothetical protein